MTLLAGVMVDCGRVLCCARRKNGGGLCPPGPVALPRAEEMRNQPTAEAGYTIAAREKEEGSSVA